MAWLVALLLFVFYVLGLYAFHSRPGIKVLPWVALLVIAIDLVVARLAKRR